MAYALLSQRDATVDQTKERPHVEEATRRPQAVQENRRPPPRSLRRRLRAARRAPGRRRDPGQPRGAFRRWLRAREPAEVTAVMSQTHQPNPAVTFYRAVPGCRAPIRADASVLGTLPSRGFQYCEALRAASSF